MRYEGAKYGEVLRSLEADGYVELDRKGVGSSDKMGFVTITETDLKKIRYRRAFESNLPRFFKKPAITLISRRCSFKSCPAS